MCVVTCSHMTSIKSRMCGFAVCFLRITLFYSECVDFFDCGFAFKGVEAGCLWRRCRFSDLRRSDFWGNTVCADFTLERTYFKGV